MHEGSSQDNVKGLAHSELIRFVSVFFGVLTISTYSRSSRAVFDSYLRTSSSPLSATLMAFVYSSSCK